MLRILDSRAERFRLSKAYEKKVDVVNVITAPEMEMLIIFSEDKYKEFKKSGKKPSEFCMQNLKFHKGIKSKNFVTTYFKDITKLLKAIDEYTRVSNIRKGEHTLKDLIDDTKRNFST